MKGATKLIRIGLNAQEKNDMLRRYLECHPDIRKVFVLYWPRFRTIYNLPPSVESEEVEYKDIIEYPFFYRLLEEVDDNCLLVFDEILRTQNRSELTYNCAHHYANQTKHKVVFETFPFIEGPSDFMILLDFLDKGKYRGKGFDFKHLADEDVLVKDTVINFRVEHVPINDKQRKRYEDYRDKLFDDIGLKDPDTIPRNLHVYVGNWKKPFIRPDIYYIARNSRFRLENVATYQKPELGESTGLFNVNDEVIHVLDFPHRRLDFNDYLKLTRANDVIFLSTGLPVDDYYASEFESWLESKTKFAEKVAEYARTGKVVD